MGFKSLYAQDRQKIKLAVAKPCKSLASNMLLRRLVELYDLEALRYSCAGGSVNQHLEMYYRLIDNEEKDKRRKVVFCCDGRDNNKTKMPRLRNLTKKLRLKPKGKLSDDDIARDVEFAINNPTVNTNLSKEHLNSVIWKSALMEKVLEDPKVASRRQPKLFYEADKDMFQAKDEHVTMFVSDTDFYFIAAMQPPSNRQVVICDDGVHSHVKTYKVASEAMNLCFWAVILFKNDYTIHTNAAGVHSHNALTNQGFHKKEGKLTPLSNYLGNLETPGKLVGFKETDVSGEFIVDLQGIFNFLGTTFRTNPKKGTAAALWELVQQGVWATLYYRGAPDDMELVDYPNLPDGVTEIADLLKHTGLGEFRCTSQTITPTIQHQRMCC